METARQWQRAKVAEESLKSVELVERVTLPVDAARVRAGIGEIEKRVAGTPGAMFGDCFPLKHTFVDGAYVREMSMPAGMLLVSKIHKIQHAYFLLKGHVSVLTETGIVRLSAPFSGVTEPGTKRVIYSHDDVVWTTIHVTDKTDIDAIEKDIIAESYDDVPGFAGPRIDDIEVECFAKKVTEEATL